MSLQMLSMNVNITLYQWPIIYDFLIIGFGEILKKWGENY